MRAANRLGEGIEEENEDDGVGVQLTRAGQKVKKILKKRGRKARPEEEEDEDQEDEDDDEEARNPYASEEDEQVEDSDAENERKTIEEERNLGQQRLPGHSTLARQPALSRSASDVAKYPGSNPVSRAPSSGPRSRAASPSATTLLRRATSPSGVNSRAVSPSAPPSASKRKAEEGDPPSPAENGTPTSVSTKRRKPGSPAPLAVTTPVAPGDDSALIPRNDIIVFIKDKAPTTKDLLRHFKVAMARDTRNKEVILRVTKEVASMVDGKLAVKAEFA